jgi:aspartate kinase
MPLRIHKYGGTSVDGPEKIHACARRIAEDVEHGDRVVVVISAAGHTTDQLQDMAREITPTPPRREMDMLLTAGERISMALLSMALHERGIPAISFTGSQSGIITDGRHQDARIRKIRPFRILEELNRGRVVIVAGFQGVSQEKEVTTLGRGGSDTTAVALAVVFQAPWCSIFTDVPGVMSANPRVVPDARSVQVISLDAMTLLSHLGAGVVSHRATGLARKFGVPLWISHSHQSSTGTWALAKGREAPPATGGERTPPAAGGEVPHLSFREVEPVESANVLSVTHVKPVWRMTGSHWPRLATTARALYVHDDATTGGAHFTAIIDGDPPEELPPDIQAETNLALISCVGEGSMCDPEFLRKGKEALQAAGCRPHSSFAQSMAFSFLVPATHTDQAVRALHETFTTKTSA